MGYYIVTTIGFSNKLQKINFERNSKNTRKLV